MKTKKIILGLVVLLVLFFSFWGVKKYLSLKKGEEGNLLEDGWYSDGDGAEKGSQDDYGEDVVVACESQEWIVLDEQVGQKDVVSGRVELVSADKEDEAQEDGYYAAKIDDGKEFRLVTKKEDILTLIEKRKVEIGGEMKGEEFLVSKLRCVMTDEEKKKADSRQRLMEDIAKNIGSIASADGQWEVESFAWVDDRNVYVDYYSVSDDTEESKGVLLKAESSGGYETLASFGINDEGDWKLKKGDDVYKDDDVEAYNFDEALGRWIKFD